VNWADFSIRYLPHSATELANGLVAPAALIAGFLWRPRMLVRRNEMGTDLTSGRARALHDPDRGIFRWRLSLAAIFPSHSRTLRGGSFATAPRSPTAAASVLLLIAVPIPMSIFQTQGDYGATVMLIISKSPLSGCWGRMVYRRKPAALGAGDRYVSRCCSRLILFDSVRIAASEIQSRSGIAKTPSHSIRSACI